MTGWSNEDTMSFLEHYRKEPCIWNPKDVNHKDKIKVATAWRRLAESMQKSVTEVKKKKEVLMAIFRKHLKRKQTCLRSGAVANDIHKPTWFAYEAMETFLLPVYTCKDIINTKTKSQQNAAPEEMEETENDYSPRADNYTINTHSQPTTSTLRSSDTVEKQMAAAFEQLTNVLCERANKRARVEGDECDLYSKLLAKKLRELPNEERRIMMYRIDELFINGIDRNSFILNTPFPHVVTLSRPVSVDSSYSEPISNAQHVPSSPSDSPTAQISLSEPFPNIKLEHQSDTSNEPSHPIAVVSDEIIRPTFEDFDSFKLKYSPSTSPQRCASPPSPKFEPPIYI